MDKQLESIHKVSLNLLLAFDKVCRENDLIYFLDSGTALGAIRHGGFIPWDDDIDVGMPRKDYERFLRIGQELLPDDIFIQTSQTEPNYRRLSAKLRLKGTVFPESEDTPYEYNGFFIDIFPFDNVPNNLLFAKINVFVSRLIYWMVRSWRSRNKGRSLGTRLIQPIIKLFPEKSIDRLCSFYVKYCRRYENKETRFITSFFWRMTQNKTFIFDKGKMFPTKDVLFEGHPVRIMKSPEYYLTLMYGDYMELPPEDKRQYHLKGIIDFGKYAQQ